MNARAKLLDLYLEWRTWTEAETNAIETQDWAKASECHQAKAALQSLIPSWTEAAHRESRGDSLQWAAFQNQLRNRIAELIALESRNSKRLARQQNTADSNRAELEQCARNLRRVRHSYSSAPAASAWQSYS